MTFKASLLPTVVSVVEARGERVDEDGPVRGNVVGLLRLHLLLLRLRRH